MTGAFKNEGERCIRAKYSVFFYYFACHKFYEMLRVWMKLSFTHVPPRLLDGDSVDTDIKVKAKFSTEASMALSNLEATISMGKLIWLFSLPHQEAINLLLTAEPNCRA